MVQLILVSGYPSSGKTYRSNQLVDFFESKIKAATEPHIRRLSVTRINDQTLGLQRDVYREARSEKDARAAEYSAVKRDLGRDTIVIADGLNYIKGFRYQLYCEAKAVQTPSCVVHIGTPIDKCKDINTDLLSNPEREGGYPTDIFENLVYRYEEPNGMTRWDSPLFTVPYDDSAPPCEAIWNALIGSNGELKKVKPNLATVMKPVAESDYLYELDKITQEIVAAIITWQKDHVGELGGQVTFGDTAVELPASPVTLPQLQRIRRQFISLNRQHNLAKPRIHGSFIGYLNTNFG
ncbi:kti12, chromatin associated [Xanthoria calcicola]